MSISNGVDSFKVGEVIGLNLEIDNKKGKLVADECKIKLNRIVTFKSKYGKTIKLFFLYIMYYHHIFFYNYLINIDNLFAHPLI